MADSPRDATSSLQMPGPRPSSSTGPVPASSSRSSTSRSRPSIGSSVESSTGNFTSTSGLGSDTASASNVRTSSPAFFEPTPTHPSTSATSSQQQYESFGSSSAASASARSQHHSFNAPRTGGQVASHRHNRSSGAFLLTDGLGGGRLAHDANNAKSANTRSRSHRETHDASHRDNLRKFAGRKGVATVAPETPEKKTRGSPAEHPPDNGSSLATAVSADSAHAIASESTAAAQPSSSEAASSSPTRPSNSLGLDSAQIVNMALNLSESRRLAARRNVSQQLPPRLAPLPDSAIGGNLLRQLQQQRRISRTLSPRLEKQAGTRVASGQTLPSPNPRTSSSNILQPAFDPQHDSGSGPYRYHFSQSTLARAQKAKDYLELLAQQRRLLGLIPPLVPDSSTIRSRATSIGSPPATSSNTSQILPSFLGSAPGSSEFPGTMRLGRPYNPLQYIRNRKARLRERKTIDGEAQGFGDVSRTTDWVDEVAKWAATGQGRGPGGRSLPPFPSADDHFAALQSSPPPASRVTGQGASAKPKRPRIDWAIDPADMIADVYWLEQGDNKKLVEDHQWRRVFPQDTNLYRPISQRVDEDAYASKNTDSPELHTPFPALTADASPADSHAVTERDHGSTRKRARQKLNDLRTFHHRHNSSFQSQELFKLRRGSFSDTSDSDSDRRRISRIRTNSGIANGAEVLNKNMMDAIARENWDRDEKAATSTPAKHNDPQNQHYSVGTSAGGRGYPDQNTIALSPKTGHASLDIPVTSKHPSVDYDSSLPTSPELRPITTQGTGFVPALGGELSPPPSRAASPPRYRFSKVKNMFRDHSHEREKERGRERAHEHGRMMNSAAFDHDLQEKDDSTLYPSTSAQTQQQQEPVLADFAPITATSSVASDARLTLTQNNSDSKSQSRKVGSHTSPGTFESQKSHGSITSMASLRHSNHHRNDEGNSGGSTLRGFFRGGPRIDNMLRSGAAKVSDMLWRREGSEPLHEDAGADSASSSSSDEDSEVEATPRGRFRKTPLHSRSPSVRADLHDEKRFGKPAENHYLDVMPTFGRGDGNSRHNQNSLSASGDLVTRPPSSRSMRFDRLKPPRINISDASPAGSDAAEEVHQPRESAQTAALQPARRPDQGGAQDSDVSETEARSRRSSRADGAPLSLASSIGGATLEPSSSSLQQLAARPFGSTSTASGVDNSHPRWSISQPTYNNQGNSLSRRELARLRASMYSTAVLARELSRRANEPRRLAAADVTIPAIDDGDAEAEADPGDAAEPGFASRASKGCIIIRGNNGETLTWPDIAAYGTNPVELVRRPIRPIELYPLAAQILGGAIQRSGQSWQKSAEEFTNTTVPQLRQRIDSVRTCVVVDLSDLARKAADEADEVSRDLMAVQRLQVKRVEDTIEKMMRRRRRRFRWVRRAGWLTVEWLLVGFMWYVWFVVMLARVVLGFGRGIYTGVRWLLWL